VEYKCLIDDPVKLEENDLVVNPIIDWFTILERVNLYAVYNKSLKKDIIVKEVYGSYPVYLPEIGYFTALETASHDLTKKFYEDTKDVKGFYSNNGIILARIHNFDKKTNRFVTWGNYKLYKLPEDYYMLYMSNLVNDFFITPSISINGTLISPNRWFTHESSDFTADIYFNVAIIYLSITDIEALEKNILRIGKYELNMYKTYASVITLSADGIKPIEKIEVYFPEEMNPHESLLLSEKGDYFIGFFVTLNNYKSLGSKYTRNVNIVENLLPLIFVPEEIIPFMFPSIIDISKLNNVVLEFDVSKAVYDSIINRFIEFSTNQNPDIIEKYFYSFRRPIQVDTINDKMKVKMLNPATIPFLLKKFIRSNNKENEYLEELVESPNKIPVKIAQADKLPHNHPELIKLQGLGKMLKMRKDILKMYVEIWRNRYYRPISKNKNSNIFSQYEALLKEK